MLQPCSGSATPLSPTTRPGVAAAPAAENGAPPTAESLRAAAAAAAVMDGPGPPEMDAGQGASVDGSASAVDSGAWSDRATTPLTRRLLDPWACGFWRKRHVMTVSRHVVLPLLLLVGSLAHVDVIGLVYLLLYLSTRLTGVADRFPLPFLATLLGTAALGATVQLIGQGVLQIDRVEAYFDRHSAWLEDLAFRPYTSALYGFQLMLPHLLLVFACWLCLAKRRLRGIMPPAEDEVVEVPANVVQSGTCAAGLFFAAVLCALICFTSPSFLPLPFLLFSAAHSILLALKVGAAQGGVRWALRCTKWYAAAVLIPNYVLQLRCLEGNPVAGYLLGPSGQQKWAPFYILQALLLLLLSVLQALETYVQSGRLSQHFPALSTPAWVKRAARAPWLQLGIAHSYRFIGPLVVMVFFAAGFVSPSLPSSLFVLMFCLGIMASYLLFLRLLRYGVAISWVLLIAEVVVSISAISVPRSVMRLLGVTEPSFPFPSLLLIYTIIVLASGFLHAIDDFCRRSPARSTVLTPVVRPVVEWCQASRPLTSSRLRRRFYQVVTFVGNGLLKQSKNLVLLFVFAVGLSDVTVLNTVLVLLFGLLLIWTTYARRLWVILVWYTFLCALLRYGYVMVYLAADWKPVTDQRWTGFSGDITKGQILLYFFLLVAVVLQREVYRLGNTWHRPQMTVPYLRAQNTLTRIACFFCFTYFSLRSPINIICFIYLLVLLIMMPITSTHFKRLGIIRLAWYFVATYTLIVVLAQYTYQFAPIETHLVDALRRVKLSPAITGLVHFNALFLGLLPWSIVFGLTVYKSWLIIVLQTKGQDISESPQQTPLQPDSPSPEPEDPDSDLHRLALEALEWVQRFCIVLAPRSTLCALFVASVYSVPRAAPATCGSVTDEEPLRTSLAALVYVILLLILNTGTRPGATMRTLLCVHPALVMASVYLYQFPFISGNLGFLSPATWQYIGLPSVSDDMTIAQLLWPHLLVFFHGVCLFNTANWSRKLQKKSIVSPSFNPRVSWIDIHNLVNSLQALGSPSKPQPDFGVASNPLVAERPRVSFDDAPPRRLSLPGPAKSFDEDDPYGPAPGLSPPEEPVHRINSAPVPARPTAPATPPAPPQAASLPELLPPRRSPPPRPHPLSAGAAPRETSANFISFPEDSVTEAAETTDRSERAMENRPLVDVEDEACSSSGSTPAARRLPRPHTYSVSGYEPDWDVAVAARQLSDPSHLSASASGKGFDVGYGSGESTPRHLPEISVDLPEAGRDPDPVKAGDAGVNGAGHKPRGFGQYWRPLLGTILNITQFVVNEAPVRYPYTLLVFLLLLSSGLRLNNIWALCEALCVGLLLGVGRWRMTRLAWSLLLAGTSLLYVVQFGVLLGVPPALATVPLQPNSAYACKFWGASWYAFLQVQLQMQDVLCAFGIVLLTGIARIGSPHRRTWQAPPSLTHRLRRVKRDVALVRRKVTAASPMDALRAFLPPPEHTRDFTCAHKRLGDFLTYAAFTLPLYVSLGLLLICGAARRPPLSVVDLLQICLALGLYHTFHELKWRGNLLWRYVILFQYGCLVLQILLHVPPLPTIIKSSSVLQILGLRFHPSPGLLALTLAVLFLQRLNFDDPRYVFLLYEAHRKVIRGLQRAEMHAMLWRLEVGRQRANAIEQKALRRQRLLGVRRHRQQREQQLRQRLEEYGGGGDLQLSLSRTHSQLLLQHHCHAEEVDFTSPLEPPPPLEEVAAVSKWRRAWTLTKTYVVRWTHSLIVFLEHNSMAYRFRKHEARADSGPVPVQTIVKQFLFTYTEWYVYAAFLFCFIFRPSLFSVALPLSMFVYALLSTPRNWYWQGVLLYCEALILVKSMTVTFKPSAELKLEPPQADISSIYTNFFPHVAFEVFMVGLVSMHHEALRQHGLWRDFRALATPDELPPADDPPHGLWCRFAALLRRFTGSDLNTGYDYYFYSFFLQLIGFFLVMVSYFSITGSTSNLLSSIRTNLLPGPLVLTCIGLFALMCLDRITYLHKSVPCKVLLHFLQLSVFLFCWQVYVLRVTETRWGVRVLFLVFSVYLILSGRQIKYGYVLFTRNRLTDKFSDPRHYTYLAFRSIPFNFELRNLLDWSVTRTSLKFWYWIKLEDIHHELLCCRSDKEDNKFWNRKVGQPYPRRSKILVGACGFLALSLAIFTPPLLYASFSPAFDRNPIDHLEFAISFSASQQFYTSRTANPLPLLSTSEADTLAARIQKTHSALPSKLSSTDNFLQLISLTAYSQTTFSLSPPARRDLLARLNDTTTPVLIEVLTTLTRHKGTGTGASSATVFNILQTWTIDDAPLRQQFITLLQTQTGSARLSVPLEDFYSPFFYNSASGIALLPPTVSEAKPEMWSFIKPPNNITLTPTSTPLPESLRAKAAADTAGLAKQDCTLTLVVEDGIEYFRVLCKALFSGGNGLVESDFSEEEQRCFQGTPVLTEGGYAQSACPDYDTAAQNRVHQSVPLYLVVVSEKVTSTTGLGSILEHFSIVTLYTAFIAVVARTLRWMLVGKANKVRLEDMIDPSRLITLVEDIKLARAEGDLVLEEELYQELINIYRSDELIKLHTSP